jgi:Ser/Thr protein kinase RdoA (MazF antagonist)
VRDLGGNFNLNLQVSTDQGALVVRVSPEWVEADRLAAVQAVRAVRAYLRGRGWPIPRTVRTRSGRRSAQLHGRVVEVEQYVEPRGTSMTTWPAISVGIHLTKSVAGLGFRAIHRRDLMRANCLRPGL